MLDVARRRLRVRVRGRCEHSHIHIDGFIAGYHTWYQCRHPHNEDGEETYHNKGVTNTTNVSQPRSDSKLTLAYLTNNGQLLLFSPLTLFDTPPI